MLSVIYNKAPLNERTPADASNVNLICLPAAGYDCVDIG